jgi:hypothetical protein
MTPKETDEWNLRVNKPLIAWSVEKPGMMLVSDRALWLISGMMGAAVVAMLVLLVTAIVHMH